MSDEDKRRLLKVYCKEAAAVCFGVAAAFNVHLTENKLVTAPLIVAGGVSAISGLDDFRKIEAFMPNFLRPVSRPSPTPGPANVKRRRSDDGGRMVRMSSLPPRPSSPPSTPNSIPRSSHRSELSAPQSEARTRPNCTLWQTFTDEEKIRMRHICCKMSTGICLLAAGGAVSAFSHTLGGIPFGLAGGLISASAIKDLGISGIFRTPSPQGPVSRQGPESPVKRRRGLLRRRMEDKGEEEEKRKKLEEKEEEEVEEAGE